MLDKAKQIATFLVVRGLLTLLFGILVVSLPPQAVVTSLLLVFGIFAIVDGTIAVVGSLASSDTFEDWWLILLAGVLSIVIGVFTFSRPAMVATILVLYVGFRAILQGVLEIAFAVRLRRVIEGEWLYILAGAISVLFGLVMMMFPIKGEAFEGLTVVAWLIGLYAIAGGVMQLVLAGQMRSWVGRIEDKKPGKRG